MTMTVATDRAADFDAAHAEFERLRAIERAIDESGPAQDAAVSATDVAFDAMIAIPATDAARVAAKLQAVSDQYDLCASGMGRVVFAVIQAEVMAVLKAGAGA